MLHLPLASLWLACGPTRVTRGPTDTMVERPPVDEPWFERVVIIVLENQDRDNVFKERRFAALAAHGADLTDFHGVFHPSYPNYLAMISGQIVMTARDDRLEPPTDAAKISDNLEVVGLGAMNYAQGYPGDCGAAWQVGPYAAKHVPFLSFRSELDGRCPHVADEAAFEVDFSEGDLPAYVMYTPDLDRDGHDPVLFPATGLENSADWLLGDDGVSGFLGELRRDADYMASTLTVITYDESYGTDAENRIYTVLLGDMVVPGKYDGWYNHFSLLRLVEDNFALPPLAPAGAADGMSDATARRLDPAMFVAR